ncbi:hypothetical protein HY227_01985 [Candidatus Wolfebacteria bacterium]|nr:hypothetical protein [Candidatus Wolfebacteria bacterium]
MTIIQPRKNNIGKTNILTASLMTILILAAISGMFLYNSLVNLRHDVIRKKIEIGKAEVLNAELKNNFYKLVDAKNLESFTKTSSLVLEKNPEYVKKESLAAVN